MVLVFGFFFFSFFSPTPLLSSFFFNHLFKPLFQGEPLQDIMYKLCYYVYG